MSHAASADLVPLLRHIPALAAQMAKNLLAKNLLATTLLATAYKDAPRAPRQNMVPAIRFGYAIMIGLLLHR